MPDIRRGARSSRDSSRPGVCPSRGNLFLVLDGVDGVGTGKLQLATGQHPAVMKDAVCSPGGTTIVGVAELERKRFRGAVIDAIDAIQDKK